ncbi:hypothetical protein [Peribacillus frigoritolerans]|uniref:hypothetical protein n=1 Tax=Peribacillus frigoritolerans TaxID=450367 RepID=UPI0013E3FE79|nr:hypothetical protein [Peribacillus frigoritolerans]MED4689118.1 hypothetical protein [Peribacillus frigoritolerans]
MKAKAYMSIVATLKNRVIGNFTLYRSMTKPTAANMRIARKIPLSSCFALIPYKEPFQHKR